MRTKQFLFLSLCVMICLVSAIPVFAQTPTVPMPSGMDKPENIGKMENMILLATTNITEAKITKQEDALLEVTYTVNNEQGVQTDVRSSLALANEKNTIVEEQISRDVFSLGENEKKTRIISLEIPSFLKGEFTPVITLSTESGMVLSMYPMDKKIQVSGNVNDVVYFEGCVLSVAGDDSKKFLAMQGVDVASQEDLLAHCTAKNMSSNAITATPNITEYRRTVFGKKTNEYSVSPVTFGPNEKKEFTFTVAKNAEPQAYAQKIVLLDQNGKQISDKTSFHYVVQGESATVQNIVLDKNAYKKGDIATITFNYTNSADRFFGARKQGGTPIQLSALLQITDASGALCAAEKKITFEGDLFQKESITMERDCSDPSVSASIQNNDGKVLDKKTVLAKDPESKNEQNPTSLYTGKYFIFIAVGVFIFLLGVMLVLVRKLRYKSKGLKLFWMLAFLSGFGIAGAFPEKASANTYGAYACSGYCVQGMTVTVNAGTVYQPNVGVPVPIWVNLNLCANAVMNADLSYWMNQYSGTLINRGWGYNAGDNYPQTQYFVPWFGTPNPTAPGTYQYGMYFWGSMREEHCGWYPDFSCPSWLIGTTYYSFSVPYYVTVPVPQPVNGTCGSAHLGYFTDPPTANLCSSGTPSVSGQWSWECLGSNGGYISTCSASRLPSVTFSASVNNGQYSNVINAEKGDRIRFQWTSANAIACSVDGFNSSLFGDYGNLLTNGTTEQFSAGTQVKDTYTMQCWDSKYKKSEPKTVMLNVTCPETGWSEWGLCNKTCGSGTQTRSRTLTNCDSDTETQPCNTQACQPGGFQEVAP